MHARVAPADCWRTGDSSTSAFVGSITEVMIASGGAVVLADETNPRLGGRGGAVARLCAVSI